MIRVTATVITSRGCVRPANEDRIGVFGWLSPLELPLPVIMRASAVEPLVVAVADGLGGHLAGEVASEIAIAALRDEQATLVDVAALVERYQEIHAALLAAQHDRPDREGMGTTLVAAVVAGEQLLVASVGDSRAYNIEPGWVELLTTDDVTSFGGNLTQVMGGTRAEPVEPHVVTMPADRELRILLCSDGLHSYLSDAVLRELVAHDDSGVVVASLHRAVYEASAPDNVSICLVDIEPLPASPEETQRASPKESHGPTASP